MAPLLRSACVGESHPSDCPFRFAVDKLPSRKRQVLVCSRRPSCLLAMHSSLMVGSYCM